MSYPFPVSANEFSGKRVLVTGGTNGMGASIVERFVASVAYGKHEVLEGDPIEGIVIAKFPNVKAAKDWYYSEAYQSVAEHRKHGAIYHGLVVEGVS